MKKGIDISEHQKNVDYKAVRASGIEFCIPRLGYGVGYQDRMLSTHLNGCKEAGIEVTGVYHFIYGSDTLDARDNALYAVSVAQRMNLPKSCYIWCDFEYDTVEYSKSHGRVLTPMDCRLMTAEFCKVIEEAGYKTGVYTNLDYWNNWYTTAFLKDYDIWYAAPSEPVLSRECYLWQKGEVIPGIAGVTDVNFLRGSTKYREETMELPAFTPMDFVDKYMGKIYDIDGAAGIQCVDLYKIFLKEIGYPNPARPIGGDGYADNIWYRRHDLGLAPYFEFVQGELKQGDIVLWAKGSPACPSSHVAMFIEDAKGSNHGKFFGSNQIYANSPGVYQDLSLAGSLGALRYKGYGTKSTTKAEDNTFKIGDLACIPELGTAKFTKNVNVRIKQPNGEILRQVKAGESVDYFAKYIGNGHRYIITTMDRKLVLISVSGSETHGVDKWADIKTK